MRRVHGVRRVLHVLNVCRVLYVLHVLRVRMLRVRVLRVRVLRVRVRLVGAVVGHSRVGVVVHAHHGARCELVDVTVQ